MLIFIKPTIQWDAASKIQNCMEPYEEPWSHPCIIKTIDAANNTATVYLLTSFKAKAHGGFTTLEERYPGQQHNVVVSRMRYMCINDQPAEYHLRRNPNQRVPALKLAEKTQQLPRASYINVEQTYDVELKHVDWFRSMGTSMEGWRLDEQSFSTLKSWECTAHMDYGAEWRRLKIERKRKGWQGSNSHRSEF